MAHLGCCTEGLLALFHAIRHRLATVVVLLDRHCAFQIEVGNELGDGTIELPSDRMWYRGRASLLNCDREQESAQHKPALKGVVRPAYALHPLLLLNGKRV